MKVPLSIVKATLVQLLGRRRLILFGLLAAAPAVITSLNSDEGPGNLDSLIGPMAFHLTLAVPVTTLILSTGALGSERRDATLSFVAARPIGRATIVAAKTAAAFAAAGTLNIAGALALGVVYGARTGSWDLAAIVAGSAMATLIYTAIFMPLGYFTERATLIGLAYVFIWENGIIGPLGILGVTSPWRIGNATFVALSSLPVEAAMDDFALSNLSVNAGESLLQAAFFVAASIALLTWTLRTRDLT